MPAATCTTCGQGMLHKKNNHSRTWADNLNEQLPYGYKRLTKEKNKEYIRILVLKADASEGPAVVCELTEIEFSDLSRPERNYDALSWCWGQETSSTWISIEEYGRLYKKAITPDLLAALKALRYKDRKRYIWVDAICINQANLDERSHQVEMMADIYGRASRVCIWLGEGDDASRMALEFIDEEVLQLQNFDALCDSEETSEKWSALLNLMQRPWFSRRWVVQEIALAKRAVVYCGEDKIAYKKFAIAVELFVEVETATHRLSEVMKKDPKFYHVPQWFEYVSALGASLLVEATGKLFRDYKPNGPIEADSEVETDRESELRDWQKSNDPSDRGEALLTLEYLVSSLAIFEVTKPHDAIYAMLAIAKDTIPSAEDDEEEVKTGRGQQVLQDFTTFTAKKKYKVDYKQAYTETCKVFVNFCIHRSEPTRALDILCRPWAPEPGKLVPQQDKDHQRHDMARDRPMQSRANGQPHSSGNQQGAPAPNASSEQQKDIPLPSWIPRLNGAAFAMYHQAGSHTQKMGRKNADSLVGLPSSSQGLQRNYSAAGTRTINLKYLRFRRREEMSHYSMYVQGFILAEIVELQPASQSGAIPQGWAETGKWVDCPNKDPPDDFWRTLVADRGRDGRNPPAYYSRACKESFKKGGLSSGSVNTTDLIQNERCSVIAQFCRRVQAVVWNRCLVRTDTDRLGLTCQYAQKGDLICILYGCSVPVVLRRICKEEADVDEEVKHDRIYLELEIHNRILKNWRAHMDWVAANRELAEEDRLKRSGRARKRREEITRIETVIKVWNYEIAVIRLERLRKEVKEEKARINTIRDVVEQEAAKVQLEEVESDLAKAVQLADSAAADANITRVPELTSSPELTEQSTNHVVSQSHALGSTNAGGQMDSLGIVTTSLALQMAEDEDVALHQASLTPPDAFHLQAADQALSLPLDSTRIETTATQQNGDEIADPSIEHSSASPITTSSNSGTGPSPQAMASTVSAEERPSVVGHIVSPIAGLGEEEHVTVEYSLTDPLPRNDPSKPANASYRARLEVWLRSKQGLAPEQKTPTPPTPKTPKLFSSTAARAATRKNEEAKPLTWEKVPRGPSYFQVMGEAFLSGLMDGEAITYQNVEGIPAQVFELR